MAENYTTASVTGCSAVEETKHQSKICKYKVCRSLPIFGLVFIWKYCNDKKDIGILIVVFNQALTV